MRIVILSAVEGPALSLEGTRQLTSCASACWSSSLATRRSSLATVFAFQRSSCTRSVSHQPLSLLESAFTNHLVRNPFRICIYKNCRVGGFSPLPKIEETE